MTIGQDERGASAIFVGAAMLLMLGMASISIDLGAGWNERRQDQIAADLAATAGAVYSADESQLVATALTVARENLTATYTDPEWQALWEACTDTPPPGFVPLTAPWNPTVELQCLSSHPAADGGPELRVRIPDQLTDTTFGTLLGVSQLTTRATAHASFVFLIDGAFVPFGILNGAATGVEQCVLQPPGGLAAGPCSGPTAGNFGTIQIPAWGNSRRQTSPNCNRSDTGLIAQNAAIGSDHIVLPAVGPDGTPSSFPGSGGPHPGDGAVPAGLAKYDNCTLASGEPEATDPVPTVPLNTVDTDTGSDAAPIKRGLIGTPGSSDPVYPGGEVARLRQLTNSHWIELRERDAGEQSAYLVDNTPLWLYLRGPGELQSDGVPLAGSGESCNRNYIESRSWPDNRNTFMSCLQAYEAYLLTAPDPKPLFTSDLISNPRFGWAPRFHYSDFGDGTTWQPVHSFVAVYLDGVWFNCNGSGAGSNNEPCDNSKGVHFYPAEYPDTTILKSGAGPFGGRLRIDQMSAIVLPTEALSFANRNSYPGIEEGPFEIQLVR